jgi:biopolymer transport protein ExbD
MARRRMRRARFQAGSIDEINMTPLLDLTFLLLIAFMITMPLMEYGTSIKAPEMNSEKLPDENFKTVSISKTGTLTLDKEVLSQEELIAKLQQLKQNQPKLSLLLKADGERSYKDVIELMALIRKSGFKDVTLVTQMESN